MGRLQNDINKYKIIMLANLIRNFLICAKYKEFLPLFENMQTLLHSNLPSLSPLSEIELIFFFSFFYTQTLKCWKKLNYIYLIARMRTTGKLSAPPTNNNIPNCTRDTSFSERFYSNDKSFF